MDARLKEILTEFKQGSGRILVLTGAGISAESGIPTFRGEEGYWVVGSKNYMPQEMATQQMFRRSPEEVWRWYLYRFSVCREVEPNDGHYSLVELEKGLEDRFTLVTQNIDGLHRRAGSSPLRTYSIHGDSAWVRCSNECTKELIPLPEFTVRSKDHRFTEDDQKKLTCPGCGNWLRPHVLWFDEYYNEEYYKFQSSIRAAQEAALLLVVGTSGATNLPMQIGSIALRKGAAVVDINPEENPFSQMAYLSPRGAFVQGTASNKLPDIVGFLLA